MLIFKDSLKGILYEALKSYKKLSREQAWELAKKHGYISSNIERRARELCADGFASPRNSKGKIVSDSTFISYWKWEGGKGIVLK